MTEIEITEKNKTKNLKLFSSKAIGGATFLGGPLAAGYMIGENFKSLDKPKEGRNSLIIGIVSTIILFAGLYMIPEIIIDKIPGQLIPLIYTGIIYGIVEWKQGNILKYHKEKGNSFFSGWRAAGIGFISLLIIAVGLFGYVFFGTNNDAYEQYDNEISVFSKNETETLKFYDFLGIKTDSTLVQDLEKTIIPKWKENIQIIKKTNEIENLSSELIEQNKILLKYSELRLEAFTLFKKAIEGKTAKYDPRLDQLHQEIDRQLENLTKI